MVNVEPHPDSLAALLLYARRTSKVAPPAGHEDLVRLTLRAASILVGSSPSSLGRYENGESVPRKPVLCGILAQYQTERDDPALFARIMAAWTDASGGGG